MLGRLALLLSVLLYGVMAGTATWHDHHAHHAVAGHDCIACHWNLQATTDVAPTSVRVEFSAVTFPAPVPVLAEVPVILCPLAASRAPPLLPV